MGPGESLHVCFPNGLFVCHSWLHTPHVIKATNTKKNSIFASELISRIVTSSRQSNSYSVSDIYFNIFICYLFIDSFLLGMIFPISPGSCVCSNLSLFQIQGRGGWFCCHGRKLVSEPRKKTRGTIWNVSWVQNLGAIYKWKGILTLENTHKRCNCWFIFGSSLNMTCYHSVICRRNTMPYVGVCLIVCLFFCLLVCLLACFHLPRLPKGNALRKGQCFCWETHCVQMDFMGSFWL